MKGGRYLEPYHPVGPGLLQERLASFDGVFMTRDHHLAGSVQVGHDQDILAGRPAACPLDLFLVQPQHGRHPAGPRGQRRVHEFATAANATKRVREPKRTGCHQGGIFAQGVSQAREG